MNNQRKYYLLKCWDNLFPHQRAWVAGLLITAILFSVLFAVTLNNSVETKYTLQDSIAILNTKVDDLRKQSLEQLEENRKLKVRIHTLGQAMITITEDLTKLNDTLNAGNLDVIYTAEQKELQKQINDNMKLIESVMPETLDASK